jgi:hypothetical protein
MLKYRFQIVFFLSILSFGCQNNATIAEIQIDVENQTFTISNGIRNGSIIGRIEPTKTPLVNYFLLKQPLSEAFSLDSITGILIITDVSVLYELPENVIELEVLISRTGNYIEHGVVSKIFINVINDQIKKQWNSREQQAIVFDALVNSLYPTTNYNAPSYNRASAWTNNLKATITRTYLKFDLSTVPQGAKVESARLFLYSPSDSIPDHSHSTLSGPNEFFVRRVIEEWNPKTINWHNQPAYSSDDEVLSASSLTRDQDYEIDITTMVRFMIESGAANNGFLIMLKKESFYRQICFSSSNSDDYSQRPYLQIEYIQNH